MLARELSRLLREPSLVIDRRINIQAVFQSDFVVFLAVARSSVHNAGSRLQGHVIAQDDEGVPFDERVVRLEPFEFFALELLDNGVMLDAELLHCLFQEPFGQNEHASVGLNGNVIELGMERNGQVRDERPGGRGPNNERDFFAAQGRERLSCLGQVEPHVHRRGFMVRILHLGLGKGCFVEPAPVHRLLSFIEAPVSNELPQLAHDRGLVAEIHGEVGVLPVAEHAQPLELLALDVDELFRIFAAELADLVLAHALFLRAEGLQNLVFDRQAVAVPARHVGAFIALHGLELHDDVFEDLIKRMADVDMAVRVGRAVVQDIAFPPGGLVLDELVYFFLLPLPDHARFEVLQVRLHREIGLGQIQCCLVIHSASLSHT